MLPSGKNSCAGISLGTGKKSSTGLPIITIKNWAEQDFLQMISVTLSMKRTIWLRRRTAGPGRKTRQVTIKKLLDSMPKAPCTAFLMCLTNERRAPIRPIPFGAWDIRRSILTLCQHSRCRHQRKNTGKWKKYWGIPLEKRVRQR